MNMFLLLGEIIMRITYSSSVSCVPLSLHHNDGVSCMSYLFLTTCKDTPTPIYHSLSSSLTLCSSWQGYSLLNTQTVGAPPWAH